MSQPSTSFTPIDLDSHTEEDEPRSIPPRESWIGYPVSTFTQQPNANHPPKPNFLAGGMVEIYAPLPPGTVPENYLRDLDSTEVTSAGTTEYVPMAISQPSTSQTSTSKNSTMYSFTASKRQNLSALLLLDSTLLKKLPYQ